MPKRDFGNATKMGNGTWRIRWPRLDEPTKRDQECGFPTRELAEARLAQIRLDRANERVYGKKVSIEPMTVREYVPKFLERWRRRGSAPTSIKSYEWELKAACRVCGDEALHKITRERALRIREELRVGARGNTLAAQTVNDRFSKLSTMYQAAIEDGHATENPFSGVRQLPVKRREFSLMNYDDRERYLSLMDPDLRDFAEFTMEAGLRQGEMFRMRKQDVFLKERRVLTRDRKNKKPLWTALTSRALSIIERRIEMSQDEYVWPYRRRTKGFAPQWVKAQKKMRAVGIDPLWPHAWRHLCAATHAQAGASAPEIARILGVTIEVANRYLDHAPGNWLDRGVERLERLRGQRGEVG